jgi:chemotaxis protein MotB
VAFNKREILDRRLGERTQKEWLTVYSDMMTNLMLFFLMLFAMTGLSADEKSRIYDSMKRSFTTIKEKARFKEVLRVEKETKDKISEVVSRYDMARISVSEKYININLPNPILFKLGGEELMDEGKEVLDQLARVFKTIHHQIVVEGHTDNQPVLEGSRYFSNWELSAARAMAAVNYLISGEISPSRVSAVAYGEHHPLFPNDTEESRAKNRRIEINILREG